MQVSKNHNKPRLVAQFEILAPQQIDVDALLRQIIYTSASDVAVLDESGTVLYVSRLWSLWEQHNEWLSDSNASNGYRMASGEGRSLKEDIQMILDGNEREFHKEYSDLRSVYMIHGVRLDVPRSTSFRVLLSREDVTGQREAQEALRNLGGSLIRGQEEERRRVARELHDNLNQKLAILSIGLGQLEQKLPRERRDLQTRVQMLSANAREIASEIQRLSHQLHPAKLDLLGLVAGIKSLCDEISEHYDIEIDFRQKGFTAALENEVKLCVYRVAQEALHNVARHSGTRSAQVLLERTSKGVHLRVSDSGCGFDVRSPRNKGGLGLISMKERLRLVGGRISIQSRALTGTQIDVLVPNRSHPTFALNFKSVDCDEGDL